MSNEWRKRTLVESIITKGIYKIVKVTGCKFMSRTMKLWVRGINRKKRLKLLIINLVLRMGDRLWR